MINYAGAEWLKTQLKYTKPNMEISDLGHDVADLLGDLFMGLYHIQPSVMRVDWSNGHHIVINLHHKQLATCDFSELTFLVILCHDRCIRCSISAVAPNTLQLIFHRRKREGSGAQRHPTIEEAVQDCRRACKRTEGEPE